MSNQIDAVERFFEAVAERDVDAAQLLTAPTFSEHDPLVADGITGLAAYIRQLAATDHRTLVRTLEDESYVVAQSDGIAAGLNTFFDVFRFEHDLIAEHWRFSAEAGPPNKSGHTQVDGPTHPQDLDRTEQNKIFLRDYYETFHLRGDHGHPEKYFIKDRMVRHEPGVRDGVQEFLNDVQVLMQHRTIDRIKLLLGQGDFVFLVAEGTHEGKNCLYIDLYRIEGLKIVEHWGFPQPVPETSRNSNGLG